MTSTYHHTHAFQLVSHPHRVFSGRGALDALPREVQRHGASRVLVLCGRTVGRGALIGRLRALLGTSLVGVYDGISKETPLDEVLAARDVARQLGADLLVAVGAGSVVQGARVVAILLAESAPVEQLITHYPDDGGPAVSPRLMAPKLPIINVLTAATTAQNRGGSPAKVPGFGRRMEFFDPKTRPVAIFWDADALATAPAEMMRASAGAIYWRAAMNLGCAQAHPLADGARRQAYALASRALARAADALDVDARIDLCAATYLVNLEADYGAPPVAHWVARVVYAFGAAIFNLHPHVSQGAAHAAVTSAVMRRLGPRDPQAIVRMARDMGVWREGDALDEAPQRCAAELERVFRQLGLPVRGRELDLPVGAQAAILSNSLRNFNADPEQEFRREEALLRDVLAEAW